VATLAQFRERFTEFERISDPVCTAKIDEASRRVDPEMYGVRTDDAILWLAAHLTALGPHGKEARLASAVAAEGGLSGGTIYYAEFQRLQRIAGSGYRVI
jgi:hypothetical protein